MISGSKWLWDCEDVQKDILILQQKYKEQMGYNLTKEQAFNSWYIYCEYCCANWMYIDEDLKDSEWAVKKVLNIK